MVPDLLIGNFKAHRFDVELLCPLQILEVEFNTDESRLNPLHKILSGFEYSAAEASEKPYHGNAQNGHIKTTLDTGCQTRVCPQEPDLLWNLPECSRTVSQRSR
jgi:hypothetical protein